MQAFLIYLTQGQRGESRTDYAYAESFAGARATAEELNPGWRVYGVRMVAQDRLAA